MAQSIDADPVERWIASLRGTRTHHVATDPESDGPVMETVAMELAALEDVPPESLEIDLSAAVDTDAIEALVQHNRRRDTDAVAAFEAGPYRVVVRGDGQIAIVEGG